MHSCVRLLGLCLVFVVRAAAADAWAPYETAILQSPLNVQVLRVEERQGVRLTSLRYSSISTAGDEVPRIYALLGLPERAAARVPGLVHIHGIGQTASAANVMALAQRGYAVLSFDWTGPSAGRADDTVSQFPAGVGGILEGERPENTRLFQVVLAARRGLGVLAAEPGVDPERLGVYGLSLGGLACWYVNGTDARVKCALPMYACALPADPGTPRALVETLQVPQYAARQHGEVLFVAGTNELLPPVSDVRRVLEAGPKTLRACLVPNEMHGLDREARTAALRWFDLWLRRMGTPRARPAVAVQPLPENGWRATAVAPGAERVLLAWSYGDGPDPLRHWRTQEMARRGGLFEATVAPAGPLPVSVLATALFEDGAGLSSLPLLADAASPETGTPVEDMLFEPEDGGGAWFLSWPGGALELVSPPGWFVVRPSRVDQQPCLAYLAPSSSAQSMAAFCRSPSCPTRSGEGAKALVCEINLDALAELSIELYLDDDALLLQSPYVHRVPLDAREGWQRLELTPEAWRGEGEGRELPGFGAVRVIGVRARFRPGCPVELRRLAWVR